LKGRLRGRLRGRIKGPVQKPKPSEQNKRLDLGIVSQLTSLASVFGIAMIRPEDWIRSKVNYICF
jgi:hypothetical protein